MDTEQETPRSLGRRHAELHDADQRDTGFVHFLEAAIAGSVGRHRTFRDEVLSLAQFTLRYHEVVQVVADFRNRLFLRKGVVASGRRESIATSVVCKIDHSAGRKV